MINEKLRKKEFSFDSLDNMPQNRIKTDLLPVLRFGAFFDLKLAREKVTDYLKTLLVPTQKEMDFIEAFSKGEYRPKLLFDEVILQNVSSHPMAIWKCNKTTEQQN